MYVVHETPGLIDPKAFTTFGINAKPNKANPIGYFGTGLKYAVAVLIRHGCRITVWIGEEPHEFYGEKTRFRDKEFLQLRMKRQRGVTARWMSSELPFTTELGKNWELWMALRELESNTRDENGRSYALADGTTTATLAPIPNTTRIVIEGEAYAEAFAKLSDIFLGDVTDHVGFLYATRSVECRGGESAHGYYRGLRAVDLQRKSVYTWNILTTLELTEDRTVKYPFMLDYYITEHVMASKDEDFIKSILQAPENTLEGCLPFNNYADSHYASPEFLKMATIYGRKNTTVYVERAAAAERRKTAARDWRHELVALLEPGTDNEALVRVLRANAVYLKTMLKSSIDITPSLEPEPVVPAPAPTTEDGDDMPF